jgi:hypothetical protein
LSANPRPAAGREAPIERATLVKIARDTAARRMAARPSLLSAYLTGSVAAGEPLLGDATDIDLVLIDGNTPPVAREVVRLTDQVALDIHHRSRADYANPKSLRGHPWLGPELAEPMFLSDPQHFFELAQSSARGQYYRAEYVAARSRTFLAWARGAFHIGLLPGAEPEAPVSLDDYGLGLLYAANAAISLAGFPGAGRRLAMKLEAAAGKLGRPDLYDDFQALFGGSELTQLQAEALLADWLAAYRAGQSTSDERIHPARRTIYERGFRAQILADRAAEGLWLMLVTWNACMHASSVPAQAALAERWRAFLDVLGLTPPDGHAARVQQAIEYVTRVDEAVEDWASKNGA